MRHSTERGIAMITTLLVMMLLSALLVGFTAVVMSDQRYRFIDRDRGQAFYAASGALEKMTADLGNLFSANVAPTGAQVTSLTTSAPSIAGVTYTATSAPGAVPASFLSTNCAAAARTTVGTSGYTIMFCADANGKPAPVTPAMPLARGPYAGLIALQTPYQLDVTARTSSGGEVHLVRTFESVAIPVFQFGMFSDVDLAFFAGPNFDFGGRVHTNGHLFLSEGGGATLWLRDKVTAVREVVRQQLQNGVSITTPSTHDGTVSMARGPGVFRSLAATEGSVTGGPDSSQNEPTWHTISLSTYNSYIRSGGTGATQLNLPLVTVGGTNPDLIRRPPPGEDVSNGVLFNERLFSRASIRILLSDAAADITGLPTVTSTAPVQLDGDWNAAAPNNGTAYGPIDATHPPIARTLGPHPAITVSGNHAATWTALNVNAVPAYFKIPATITVTPAVGAAINTSCTGKTATTFTGCNPTPAANVAIGAAVTGAVNSVTPSTTTTLQWSVGSSTITVSSTLAFAPDWFWVTNTNNTQSLVTCTGYVTGPDRFTGCAVAGGTLAVSNGAAVTTGALSNAQTGTIGGFIKIDMQDADGVWRDVTMEILNYGIGGPNLNVAPSACADPTPNAILRIQRLRSNGGGTPTTNGGGCHYAGSTNAGDYQPNVLFDTREALLRDAGPALVTNLPLGGVMHYIAIDVANLSRWFAGAAPYAAGTGATARTDNGGFTVYFSDRRNNRNATNQETGEYGWEDFVNPTSPTGAPSGVLDAGEDVNANSTLDTYGGISNYLGTYGNVPPGAVAPLDGTARPTTYVSPAQAQVNRPILFRHALKLVSGSNIAALGVTGLTVVAENPVYVQGDWNATGGNFNGAHAATAVIADAVTLLSNAWTDTVSFTNPYNPGNRARTNSWYRMAIIAGKGAAFAWPNGTATDFGTDGGAHNFLRYLESGATLNYRGSIATFFYNRQAVGTYKCCTTVYSPPTRNYAFDTDFLTPALLPPNTPVFRDMNAVGFSQDLRPGK